jgi:hypothetical protein
MDTTQLKPFRPYTRQRSNQVGFVAYTQNQQLPSIELPKIGLLSLVKIRFEGTITHSAISTAADLAPWSLLRRIRITLNQGSQNLVDTSGYGLFVQNMLQYSGYSPDKAGIGNSTPNVEIYTYPLSGTATRFAVNWYAQISLNEGSNFHYGLIPLQAPEVRCTVELVTGSLIEIGNNVTDVTGNFFISTEYFDFPADPTVMLPKQYVVRTIEESQSITTTGDNIYTLPRMGILLNLAHVVSINGARNDSSIDRFVFQVAKTDRVYDRTRYEMRLDTRRKNGVDLPVGVYAYQFMNATENPNTGDFRDAFDTEDIATIESIVSISPSASLGTTSYLASIRRILQEPVYN